MPFTAKKLTPIRTDSLNSLGDSVLDLAKYVEDEFGYVASALQGTEPDHIWNRAPPRPRRGSYVYADGTNFNPGSGEGPYWFDGGAYHPMGQGAITDAPSDGNIYGRKNGAWSVVPIIRSYLAGLTLSTAGASTTFSVAAGQAVDRTNIDYMSLASAISKTTAAWAVGTGNGGIDTGAVAINTWYHVHVIKRPDTGVVDVAYSLSATAPTFGVNIPVAYTISRRIGSMRTNASSQWTSFVQLGDEFLWTTSVVDVSNLAVAATPRTLYTLSVPTGLQVNALFRAMVTGAAAQAFVVFTSPDESDQAPGGNTAGVELITQVGLQFQGGRFNVRTNTSGQIGGRSSGSPSMYIQTFGWIDGRGKLS